MWMSAPTPLAVNEFLGRVEQGEAAYREVVERLLKSPRYGERWAQHWLDVVRYADTHGFEVNTERPNAWPYRDYVIESMNNELRKATRNRVQFTNDDSAIKTLWLMICNIEDKRAAKRAKQGKRVAPASGRLVEGTKVTNWRQAINQMAVAFPDRFEAYL